MPEDSVKRLTKTQKKRATEWIVELFEDRARESKHTRLMWDDIDRQVEMRPSQAIKRLPDGQVDRENRWMADMELPFQAQALEVLSADARRMIFPDAGLWFRAHAETTDEYLARAQGAVRIPGDENDIPSLINQDNADKLVAGLLEGWHRQYNFRGNVGQILSESLSYGMGVGRMRIASKSAWMHEAKGVARRDIQMPVLVPRSIKNTYLDNLEYSWMNEGEVASPSTIFCETKRLVDLQKAAKGSNDPMRLDGGWMPSALSGLKGDKHGEIEVLEFEGDLVVPQSSSGSMFIPNIIVSVARDRGKKPSDQIFRVRFNQLPSTSYITFPYQHQRIDDPYGGSPLMKGRPIQIAAVDALNKLMDSGALKNQPPISWDATNMAMASQAGPRIAPGETWENASVEVHADVGGEPETLLQVFIALVSQYADVTGVNAPRLGAQTVSHTTLGAKELELNRGVVRTVDFVRDTLDNPMARWLSMAYEAGLKTIGNRTFNIWIDAYRGFVQISRAAMPDRASFETFGAGGPAENRQKAQDRFAALQQAIQLDVLGVQAGQPPNINIAAAVRQTLLEGGWTDVDVILNPEQSSAQQLPPGPATQALQALSAVG